MINFSNKITQIANNSLNLYNAGYEKGVQECTGQLFQCSQLGNDTSALEVQIPFKPTIINIWCFSEYAVYGKTTYWNINLQLNGYASRSGAFQANRTGTLSNVRLTPSQISTYATYDKNTKTFKFDLGTHSTYNIMRFHSNMRYYISAQYIPNYSIRSAVIEEINLLPDVVPSYHAGTIEYNEAAIYSAFTANEWIELTGTKTAWTFVLTT